MNVNKKLGRLKHWAGEKMAGEVRTTQSEEFKSLEVEMGLRQEGKRHQRPDRPKLIASQAWSDFIGV